jgi:hypothetical protein
MSQRRTLSFLAATILLACATFDFAAQPTAPPIRRIDHIMIRADDPAKVYAFFTEVLQLPSPNNHEFPLNNSRVAGG